MGKKENTHRTDLCPNCGEECDWWYDEYKERWEWQCDKCGSANVAAAKGE